MTGYTKLFGSIVASTIWEESNETRIVWITMLAMADQYGIVDSSVPGLAKFAKVSIEDTQLALKTLMSPDPYSRSKEYDGRRIQETDGGWLILNHGKYRAKSNYDERRERTRQRVALFRERHGNGAVTGSNACNAPVTECNACNNKHKHKHKQKHIGSRYAQLYIGSRSARLDGSSWTVEAFEKQCVAIQEKHDLNIEATERFITDKQKSGYTKFNRLTNRREPITAENLEALLIGFNSKYIASCQKNFLKPTTDTANEHA
jgi:hypothetical protein